MPTPDVRPLKGTARAIGVTSKWLKQEAEAGRIPCLRAGTRFLFDVGLVREALSARMRDSVGNAGEESGV